METHGGSMPASAQVRWWRGRAPPCSWERRAADHPGGAVPRGFGFSADVFPA